MRSKTNKSALTTAEILSLMNMQSAVTVKTVEFRQATCKKAAAKASAKKAEAADKTSRKKNESDVAQKKDETKSKRRTKSRKQLIPAAPKNALLQKLPKLPTG